MERPQPAAQDRVLHRGRRALLRAGMDLPRGYGMILVDLDKTLAHYTNWQDNGAKIGEPIPAMVDRVKYWLAKGIDVRIFTARAAPHPRREIDLAAIEGWCLKHIGQVLPIQNWKDFECEAIWDDLAVSVEANTGRIVRRLDLDVAE